jgi:hypothetical protein
MTSVHEGAVDLLTRPSSSSSIGRSIGNRPLAVRPQRFSDGRPVAYT